MSLAQAFQTAAAYRQGIIDQNQQAAMQAPMLAVQALSVGLQAQAQQQDMQFKMQSMVLQTQLQIEETKTKQAMQLMEFDLKSRQLNANEQIARQELELARQRTTAQVAASGLQAQEAKAGLEQTVNAQSARTALGMLRSKYTDQQILSGAAEAEMQEFAKANPAAFGILQEDLSKTAQASSTALRSEMIQIERAMNEDIRESTRGLSAPQAMAARSRLEQHYLGVLQQKEQHLSGLERRPPRSFTAAPSIADLFPSRSGLDPKDAIEAYKMLNVAETNLASTDTAAISAIRAQKNVLLKGLGLPVTGEDPAAPAKPAGVTDITGGATPLTRNIADEDFAQRAADLQSQTAEQNRATASESLGTATALLTQASDKAAAVGDTAAGAKLKRIQQAVNAADRASMSGGTSIRTEPLAGYGGVANVASARYGTITPGEAKQIKAIATEAAKNGNLDDAIQKIDAILKKLELPL